MLCIRLENNDPYFCLAAEEYLLKNFPEDISILWQGHNTVVVGKHQNLLAEVDYRFCIENGITLARRISGGGTVFHDRGNVNFSFIKNVTGPHEISFQRFVEPVRQALKTLDVETVISGRNDLLVDGLKISGNAEHVYKNRVLHHGTLLFDSDLGNLGAAIKNDGKKYESRAVQSNRSPVANISSFLKKKLTTDEFANFLLDFVLCKYSATRYFLTDKDWVQIEALARSKFTSFEWLFGYSPAYSFKNRVESGGKILEVALDVKQGLIEKCRIGGDLFTPGQATHLSSLLPGRKHIFSDLKDGLKLVFQAIDDGLIYSFF